jgi:hypothetical protein
MRLVAFALIWIAGCSTFINNLQTPTASPYISEQQAIDIAIASVSVSAPERSGSLIPIENARAELMTFADAENRMGLGYVHPTDQNTMVWLVSGDGLWTDGFPSPAESPRTSPTPLHHFMEILNAKTGDAIAGSVGP